MCTNIRNSFAFYSLLILGKKNNCLGLRIQGNITSSTTTVVSTILSVCM